MKKTLSGSCLCGAVEFRIAGDIESAFYCHCNSCRRSAAAPYVAWGRVREDDMVISGGELMQVNSSAGVTRSRCAACGTEIRYSNEKAAPYVDFLLALLDEPEKVPPAYHVMMSEKLPWVEVSDGLDVYEKWRTRN